MKHEKRLEKTSLYGVSISLLLVFSTLAVIVGPNAQIAEAADCAPLNISGVQADDYQGSNVPKNTLDNKLSTRWSSPGKGAWIIYDAGQKMNICNLDIAWYKGNDRQYSFTIGASLDANTYQTVYSGKSSGNTNNEERYEFADVAARYVKITVFGSTENTWASITEVDVRGHAVAIPLTIAFANVNSASVITGNYVVDVTASDPSRVSKIDLFVDSTFIKSEYNDPYEFATDSTKFSDGTHSLKAVAKDTVGNLITITQSATFKNLVEPEEPEPTPLPSEGKYLLATMLQYVSTDTQVNIYKPNMENVDKPRIHVGLNKGVSDSQLNGLLSLPGEHGLEYFSLAEIKANAPLLKAKGIEVIDYDLEPGDGHSPDSDLVDPVASIKAASQAAHSNGLLFRCSPSKAITTNYGAQLAPYCDQYHIQAQGLQDRPAEYESFVENIVAKLRAANPEIKVSVQVSTQRSAADGMTLLETMKTDFTRVADKVDGVSVWFSNDEQALSVLESFSEWFDGNYR